MVNAGPVNPDGCRQLTRFAGSAKAFTDTLCTEATSAGSTTATGDGSRHQASTGDTPKLLTGTHKAGQTANGTTPAGSSPVSSSASLRAVRTMPSSPVPSAGSTPPPGNAICPACLRNVQARSVSSTSGPLLPSASRMSTADFRTDGSSGGRNLDSWVGSTSSDAFASGFNQPGISTPSNVTALPPASPSPAGRAPVARGEL